MPQDPRKSRARRAERAPLRAAVSFRPDGGKVAYGWSGDVSLVGVYVRTDERAPIGALCRLRLTVRRPGGSVRVDVDAQVARYDAEGIAFQFTGLSDEARALIAAIVETHAREAQGDPAPAPAALP